MKCLSKPKLNWERFVLLSLCLFIRSGSTHLWSPLPGTEGVGGNSMDQTHHLGQAGVLERGRLPAWYLTNGPSVSLSQRLLHMCVYCHAVRSSYRTCLQVPHPGACWTCGQRLLLEEMSWIPHYTSFIFTLLLEKSCM